MSKEEPTPAEQVQLDNIHTYMLEKFLPKAKELGVDPKYVDFVIDTVETMLQQEVDLCIKNLLLNGVMKQEDFNAYLQKAKEQLDL